MLGSILAHMTACSKRASSSAPFNIVRVHRLPVWTKSLGVTAGSTTTRCVPTRKCFATRALGATYQACSNRRYRLARLADMVSQLGSDVGCFSKSRLLQNRVL